jgi:hypothetical protein
MVASEEKRVSSGPMPESMRGTVSCTVASAANSSASDAFEQMLYARGVAEETVMRNTELPVAFPNRRPEYVSS